MHLIKLLVQLLELLCHVNWPCHRGDKIGTCNSSFVLNVALASYLEEDDDKVIGEDAQCPMGTHRLESTEGQVRRVKGKDKTRVLTNWHRGRKQVKKLSKRGVKVREEQPSSLGVKSPHHIM
jgi:hypothetical protein